MLRRKRISKQKKNHISEFRNFKTSNRRIQITKFKNKVIGIEFYFTAEKDRNKILGGFDTCKILTLDFTSDYKIFGKARNQENSKIFELKFQSLQHFQNAFKFI